MGNAPWRPVQEIQKALERGELDMAIAIMRGAPAEIQRPFKPGPKILLAFLPVVIVQRPDHYEAWAIRWFKHWLDAPQVTLDKAADIAGALAELPSEPSALKTLEDACR